MSSRCAVWTGSSAANRSMIRRPADSPCETPCPGHSSDPCLTGAAVHHLIPSPATSPDHHRRAPLLALERWCLLFSNSAILLSSSDPNFPAGSNKAFQATHRWTLFHVFLLSTRGGTAPRPPGMEDREGGRGRIDGGIDILGRSRTMQGWDEDGLGKCGADTSTTR